ncbi:MAG: hypothetical protein GY821_05590 [Gammaproteobacteria bacterium]|nr:hypothetical protein [Gammaproteobacteria bacterium]
MMDKGRILKDAVADVVRNYNIKIECKEYKNMKCSSYMWIRKIDNSFRVIRITPIYFEGAPWDYAIIGAAYRDEGSERISESEGRSGGNLKYTLNIFRRWILELEDWNSLESFESGQWIGK